MHTLPHPGALLRAAQTLNDFTAWLASDGDDLRNAVRLLGGPRWLPVAERVIDAACRGNDLHRLVPELKRLLRLLSLEMVNDLDCEEAALFMMVDPDDPRADNARICLEALDRGLAALRQVRAVRSAEAA